MVGPAGSISDGAFSWGIFCEDELCDLAEPPEEDWARSAGNERAARTQMAAAGSPGNDRNLQSVMKKPCRQVYRGTLDCASMDKARCLALPLRNRFPESPRAGVGAPVPFRLDARVRSNGRKNKRPRPRQCPSEAFVFFGCLFPVPCFFYPRTETPEKERTANPRTGWPKNRAASKWLVSSMFSILERVASSLGPETMR